MTFKHRINEIPREYWISHHPDCKQFDSHTFRLFNHRFCIGCFIGYPSAILAIIIATKLIELNANYSKEIFWIGITSFSVITLSFTNLISIKPIKMLQKFILGFGSGFFLTYIYHIPSIPFWLRLLAVIFTSSSIFGILNILHLKKHEDICRKCRSQPEFNGCSAYKKNMEINL